jgi:hypothetical protein
MKLWLNWDRAKARLGRNPLVLGSTGGTSFQT